jgi:hypothetical protein
LGMVQVGHAAGEKDEHHLTLRPDTVRRTFQSTPLRNQCGGKQSQWCGPTCKLEPTPRKNLLTSSFWPDTRAFSTGRPGGN